MDAHLSPQRKARRARRMRREEAAWARRAGDVDTRIACVCDRHPETCRAEHHIAGSLAAASPSNVTTDRG